MDGILSIFISIAKEIAEIFTYILIMWGILQCKFKKNIWLYIISILIFIIGSVSILISPYKEYIIFGNIIFEVIFANIIFRGKILRKFVFFLVAYINAAVLNILVIILLDLLPGIDYVWLMDTEMGMLIFSLVTVLPIGLVIFLIRKSREKINDWVKGVPLFYFILMIVPIFFCDILMMYTLFKDRYIRESANKYITISVILLAFFLICWSIVFISINSSKKYHKAQNSLKTKYLEIQQSNYEKILEKDLEIRKFRHDITGHMACIQMYLNENKISQLQDYIKAVQGEIDNVNSIKLNSGNDVVDAILNHLDNEARKNNIILKLDGNLPVDMKIGQFDLCTIIYNSLKNSIDACVRLKNVTEKIININFKIHKEILFIVIENPIDKNSEKRINLEKTSKKDKINHGFGIGNIKNAVSKYNGKVTFLPKKDKFLLEIILYDVV